METSNIKVVKRKKECQVNDTGKLAENTNSQNSNHSIIKLADAQADKRITKFRVTQPRVRTGTGDVFGNDNTRVYTTHDDAPVLSGSFREISRKDNIETKVNYSIDSKTARANRMGLQQSTMSKPKNTNTARI